MAAGGLPGHIQRSMLLVISELVTNAVTHARSAARVEAWLDDQCLHLAVQDGSHRPPVVRSHGDVDGGFGMRLVADAVDQWGWAPTQAGKVVWTELRVPLGRRHG